jgi:hypothetical protein
MLQNKLGSDLRISPRLLKQVHHELCHGRKTKPTRRAERVRYSKSSRTGIEKIKKSKPGKVEKEADRSYESLKAKSIETTL